MSTAKDDVRSMLNELPEDVSLEEIQHHLYVRQKVGQAREQVDADKTLSMEDVERRMSKWLGQ